MFISTDQEFKGAKPVMEEPVQRALWERKARMQRSCGRRFVCVLDRRLERLTVREGRAHEADSSDVAQFQVPWEARDGF